MTRRFVLFGVCVAAALAAAAGGVLMSGPGAALRAWLTPVSAVGGPFELVDQHGNTVRDSDFDGRPMAIAFGYTSCLDVCPTTLHEMAGWRAALGGDAQAMSFVFVTLDPERDTPQVLALFVGYFDENIAGLTGTAGQVDAIARAYKVFARRVEDETGDYLLDHSAGTYLMDAGGRYRTMISFGEEEASALGKLRALFRGS